MKKTLSVLGLIVVILLSWYLFIKDHDYQVSFETKANAGTINQTLKRWSETLFDSEILSWEGLESIDQQVVHGDSTFVYKWRIEPVHDSLSVVKVLVKDKENSLINKIKIPFSDTNFEKRSRSTVQEFGYYVLDHLKLFRVEVVGEEEFPETFCACVEVSTTQHGKAGGMMDNQGLLNNLVVENGVELNGPPIVRVNSWDKEKDSLQYDFCYPVLPSEKMPKLQGIVYKRIFKKPSLKAVYNGNYITSDRAWYALLNYAEKEGLKVSGLPIEVFHNNPNMGGDALRWKTDIYMPLEKNRE